MPDKAFYLDAVRSDAATLLEAARSAEPPLPAIAGCPGWNMADLLIHTGGVHRHVTPRMARREREFRRYGAEEWDAILDLPSGLAPWLDGAPSDRPIPRELLAWFENGTERLLAALEAVEPDEQIGTWFRPNQTGGFWQRRMAQETAVHRWDAQAAVSRAVPIDATLARDGVDEVFDVMLPMARRGEETRPAGGESYHFHQTDGEGEWLLRFEPDGVTVSREHGKADVAARGTASDLLLFLWGRVPADRLEVFGDRALLDRYFELVPPS